MKHIINEKVKFGRDAIEKIVEGYHSSSAHIFLIFLWAFFFFFNLSTSIQMSNER